MRVLGNAASAYDLSQTQIAIGGGRTIKLADIAKVTDSYGELRSLAKLNGKQVVTFSVTRARGESDVTVYDGVVKVLKQLEKENPGITFTRLFTQVDYTKQQYESSMAAMVEGAVLAVVVVFLFLRDWRATIIAALAIPLSAIPTFWFMDLLGFSLNQMSLLALGLVAGVLVDDAIVEIENIVRHMRMGKSAYQASIDAADEIGLAVVATTFSIVAVFLPVGLMPGVAGQFFKNFGLTVVASVLMSLAVARLITPMVAAYFLKAKGHQAHGEGRLMDRYMSVLHWSLDTSKADALRARLTPVESDWWHFPVALVFRLVVLAAAFAGFAGVGYALDTLVGSLVTPQFWLGFLGALPELLGQVIAGLVALVFLLAGLAVALVAGWFAARLVARVLVLAAHLLGRHFAEAYAYRNERYAARFRGDHRVWMMLVGVVALTLTALQFMAIPMQFFPNNDSDFSMIRVSMVPGTTLEQTDRVIETIAERMKKEQEVELALGIVNEGSGMVRLVLRDDRERTSKQFEEEMTPYLQSLPDVRASFQNQQGGGGGTGRGISIMLSGSDPIKLDAAANTLVEQMKDVPGAVAPRVELDLQRPELIVKPREDLAQSLGVSTSALSQAIRIATLGDIDQNAAKFSLSDRQVPIRVRLSEDSRRDMSVIRNLPVPTSAGGSVPLERVADITFGEGPTSIQRYNQNRRIFVSADVAPGFASGDVKSAINRLPIMQNLPSGVSNTPVGEDEWQAELLKNFVVALAAGHSAGLLGAGSALPPAGFAAGQHGLAVPRPARRAAVPVRRRPADFAAGLHRHPHAVRHRRQELDPADRLCDRGNGHRQGQARGHYRSRAQARPADRHDHGGDDCRHDADGDLAGWRFRLARADGHDRYRRPDALDAADPAHRPRGLQPRRRAREAPRAVAARPHPDLQAGRRPDRRRGAAAWGAPGRVTA